MKKENLLHISLDGPSMNLNLLNCSVNPEKNTLLRLTDIGTYNLHMVRVEKTEWKGKKLNHHFVLFSNNSAKRAGHVFV